MPNFETYQPPATANTDDPYVTVTARGEIKLSKSATRLIGQPRQVDLHYDRDGRIVGISGSIRADAIPLRVLRQEGIAAHGHTIAAADAKPFLGQCGIDYTVSRRYPAYLVDQLLCFDLDGRQLPLAARSPTPITCYGSANGAGS